MFGSEELTVLSDYKLFKKSVIDLFFKQNLKEDIDFKVLRPLSRLIKSPLTGVRFIQRDV